MYIPAAFRETRHEVIEAAISAHPLATLVTITEEGLVASHLPLLYCPMPGTSGVLRGHLARANPQCQSQSPHTEVLAIFQGSQHYVSPAWYPSTKEHGKVVPTWNYVAVHVYGTIRFTSDRAWLLQNVSDLTDRLEASIANPWRISDAPPEFIETMLASIVGVELSITRIEGKWKVSQNRSLSDRRGVIEGLEALDSSEARQMAELVKVYLPE